MRYVVGFMFDPDFERVALIRKARPSWQAGLLNGVGGKVEQTDGQLVDAMVREFQEETGVATSPADWTQFLYLDEHGQDFRLVALLWFYWAAVPGAVDLLETTTDERVDWYWVRDLSKPADCETTPNLPWLVRMAIDIATNPRYTFEAQVTYTMRDGVTFEP